jgi:sodium transport system permease protein
MFTIFKKELKDTLRDRRTLMMMLVIPLLVFPIIMNIFVSVSASFQKEAATKTLKIGMVGDENNLIYTELNLIPKEFGKKEIVLYKDTIALLQDLKKDSIQLGLFIVSDFDQYIDSMKTAPVLLYFNATNMGMKERAEGYLEIIEKKAQEDRYVKLGVDQ